MIRACCRVPQSVDSMGAAQIEIQAKSFLCYIIENNTFYKN